MSATIVGFVVSDPAGNYDPDEFHPREDAQMMVDEHNARLTPSQRFDQGSWEIGARFDDGTVDFSTC